jgi:hypothetical protein
LACMLAQRSGRTPWRRGRARRDQGLPKADTAQAARASQAADRPTAAHRDRRSAAATQAAAAASAAGRPASRQRARESCAKTPHETLGSHHCAPCACSATGVPGTRLCSTGVRASVVAEAHDAAWTHRRRKRNHRLLAVQQPSLDLILRTPDQPSGACVACTEALTLQAAAASGLTNSTRA